MGNSFPPLTTTKSAPNDSPLKKSRSVRDYKRSTSLITSCITSQHHHQDTDHVQRRYPSFSRPRSLAPTDAEIIDIQALRNENEYQLIQQLDYIHSCVRKDKGLFGKWSVTTTGSMLNFFFRNDDWELAEQTYLLQRWTREHSYSGANTWWIRYGVSIDLSSNTRRRIHTCLLDLSKRRSRIPIDDAVSAWSRWKHLAPVGSLATVLRKSSLQYSHHRLSRFVATNRMFITFVCACRLGFGKSSGSPSERGLYIDAQTAYDYLIYKQNVSPDNLLVFGTSLGASVAIQLVSDPLNRAKVAIFENPFTSVPEVAKYYLTYAKSVIGITKSIGFIYLFDSLEKVRRIECPCVYLTGLLDPIIPTWMSNTLYNQTTVTKKRHLFEYSFGKHNDLPVMNDYFENLQSFISELSSPAEPSVLR